MQLWLLTLQTSLISNSLLIFVSIVSLIGVKIYLIFSHKFNANQHGNFFSILNNLIAITWHMNGWNYELIIVLASFEQSNF